ncbi:MAG: C25 family cysteine peptidase [Bacteroidales bacterium]|nr:C25 family cysteine peptidase [Bacteroidales bacterium]
MRYPIKKLLYNNLRTFALIVAGVTAILTTVDLSAQGKVTHPANSKFAKGKWVRVKVPGDGICQITFEQLKEWGFSNPNIVRVFGYGPATLQHNCFRDGEMTDIYPTKHMTTSDHRLLFYGAGASYPVIDRVFSGNSWNVVSKRSYYSTESYYFITDSQENIQEEYIEDIAYQPTGYAVLNTHVHLEIEDIDKYNPGKGGAIYHNRRLSPGETVEARFPIRDFSSTEGHLARVDFRIAAKGDMAGKMTVDIPDGLEATNVSASTTTDAASSLNSYRYSEYTSYTQFKNAENGGRINDGTYTFSTTVPTSPRFSYVAYDYASLAYRRNNILLPDESFMIMHFPQAMKGQPVIMRDVPSRTSFHMWDISDPTEVRSYRTIYDDELHTVTATFPYRYLPGATSSDPDFRSFGARIIAFNTNMQFPEAEFAGNVKKQNIHGDPTPEMVIVTTEELRPYAEQLAQAHRQTDGITVNVYTQQEVYNEFSYGNRDAMGIRRMAKMFYDRSTSLSQFKYLLMYGATTYDNLGVELHSDNEQLLCYEAESFGNDWGAPRANNINYCSDMFFAFLDDNYDPNQQHRQQCQIAVGRIPATNAGDAAAVNRKIISYITNPPAPENYMRAVLFSDDGDNSGHLNQSLELDTLLMEARNLTIIRPHNSLYPRGVENEGARKRLVEALRQGTGLFSYTGHGNPREFTAEKLYSQTLINSTEYPVWPFAMLSTCNAYTLDANLRHIGESMLFKENGGAIGVVGACREVYMLINQMINEAIISAYGYATPGSTVGSVYQTGFNNALNRCSGTESFRNIMCYNLCGDPAVRLSVPDRHLRIKKINGVDLSASDQTVTVRPYDEITVEAEVWNETGAMEYNFAGDALVELYESPHTTQVIQKTEADKIRDVTLDENLIVQTRVPVEKGIVKATFRVPYTVYNGRNSRIVIVARSNDEAPAQASVTDRVYIDGQADAADVEIIPPVIDNFYIVGHDMAQAVPQDIVLRAGVTLGNGGMSVGSSIGAGMKMLIDDFTSLDGMLQSVTVNADNTATVEIPVSSMSDGAHTATLVVTDNFGTRVEKTISFIVRNSTTQSELYADTDIARESMEFDMDDYEVSSGHSRLIITDASGKTAFSAEGITFPYKWDLKGFDGNPVPDGLYNAVFMQQKETGFHWSTAWEFVVIAPTVNP